MSHVPIGRYRHYKGNEYSVLGVARHSETGEEWVVYRPEYGAGGLWVRPKSMFLERVVVDGQSVARFEHLEADAANVAAEVGPPITSNLLTGIPANISAELVTAICSRSKLRIERIVSLGQASPEGFWYDQDEHELVVVLQGAATLQFEDRSVELRAGSFLDIPAHRRHRVAWTDPRQPTVWLAIHYTD